MCTAPYMRDTTMCGTDASGKPFHTSIAVLQCANLLLLPASDDHIRTEATLWLFQPDLDSDPLVVLPCCNMLKSRSSMDDELGLDSAYELGPAGGLLPCV